MLEMLDVPYVGANHLASAIGMDKEVSKRLFREAGLDVVKYIALHFERDASCLNRVCDRVEREIGFPCFVKPANLGSSVGTNKVHNRDELTPALLDAWQYDLKILVEEAIDAREIECSLLGNSSVLASCLGEIVPRHEFYSYEAKYLDPNGAELIIGADVEEGLARRIQDAAKRAFEAIGCEGMARADFLVDKKKGIPYINEVNTIPGFTKISMYPKLLEKSGIPYHELIDRLIRLALERHELKRRLKTDFKHASR
jgi:D-alanine-D-alanine ligase